MSPSSIGRLPSSSVTCIFFARGRSGTGSWIRLRNVQEGGIETTAGGRLFPPAARRISSPSRRKSSTPPKGSAHDTEAEETTLEAKRDCSHTKAESDCRAIEMPRLLIRAADPSKELELPRRGKESPVDPQISILGVFR